MENVTSQPHTPAKPLPPKKKQRRERSVIDEFDDLAKKGDFEGLIDGYTSEWGYHFSAKDKAKLIRKALKSHARRGGTPAVIGALLDQILMFDAEFLLALQHSIRRKMNAEGRECDLSPGLIDSIANDDLPKLTATEDRVLEICRSIASIKHTLALADVPRVKQATQPRIVQLDQHTRRPAARAANGQ